MNRSTLCAGLLLMLAALASPSAAQDTQVQWSGQVRPRLETRSPVAGDWDTFVSMRTRFAVEARIEERFRVFLQIQDVRLFGEEGNTLADFSADHLDLHQGYLELASVPGVGGVFRLGRQEISLGEQRLVGAVNWAQQGRSFDGARYSSPALGMLRLDLFGTRLRDETAPTQEFNSDFLGAWGNLDLEEGGSLDLFGLFLTDSREAGTDLQTFGALWRVDAGPIRLRLEGSLQGGTSGEDDVSAYMLGVSAGGDVSDGGTWTVLYDHLSGDEDPGDGEVGVFNTLFATNHLFYGLADYFTDIPVHTGGLGLRDLGVKLSFPTGARTRLGVDLHHFRATEAGDLSTRSLGNELDLTLSHSLSRGLSVVTGYSFFQARDGMEELGRLSENGHWFYLMLDAVF